MGDTYGFCESCEEFYETVCGCTARNTVKIPRPASSDGSLPIDGPWSVTLAACCHDCLMPYEDFPLDVILPDDLWARIAPREGGHGLLCANCIVKRLSELEPSPITVRLTPVWVEDYD